MERTCVNCKYTNNPIWKLPCYECAIIGSGDSDKFEPMTCGDIIRSMSDEELAEYFALKFCYGVGEVRVALSELPPYIQPYIFYSLVDGLSYEKICARKDYLYISKGDFYGYRRKAMECIKRWMILYNIWEFKE